MLKDPTQTFTRGIAEAVEGGPFYERSLQGGGLVASTWGDYASRLVEMGVVDPSVEAVCTFLHIEPDDLADQTIHLEEDIVGQWYFAQLRTDWAGEYEAQNKEAANGLSHYLRGLMDDAWQAPADAQEQADQIQAEFDDLRVVRRNTETTPRERSMVYLKALKRDALYSGVVVSLAEFVRCVYAYDGEQFYAAGELAHGVREMIEYDRSLSEVIENNPDLPASEIILGKDQLSEFWMAMGSLWSTKKQAYVDQKWEQVKPAFIATSYAEHSLFAGNEQ